MSVDALVAVLGYGATPKLALFGVLPYQQKTLRLSRGGERIQRSQEGFGDLYVADYWNDRIQVFSLAGKPLRMIGRSGSAPGAFRSPGGVAVAANGDLFVADFHNQRIQQLDSQGNFIAQWGTTGEVGIRAGEFNYPTDVALATDGSLYVADGYNDRVQVISAQGRFQRKWGGPFAMNIFGPFNGWFATVTSVAVGPQGALFVADFYNHRVQKFAPDGTFLNAFGEEGPGPGQFNYAIAAAVAPDGSVFVADFGNNRIQKWRPQDAE
jgi:DNA-binding beta-propeller fold protein YncE